MALDYQTAYQAWLIIQSSQLTTLRNSLFKAAVHYATARSEWQFLTVEEKAEQDSSRTIIHNRFIDSCNILSREQTKIGEDNIWRGAIGTDRKLIGDWACYLSCFIGIRNR